MHRFIPIPVAALVITLTPMVAKAVDIPSNRLEAEPLTIKVVPGKATTLHFDNGEVIEHFVISDDSQLIYNTNQPSGKAQTLILRQIKSLPTPGATYTSRPNIIISTRSPDGTAKVYQILVEFTKSVPANQLVWRVVSPSYRPEEQTLETAVGTANLEHLRRGLAYILETGQAHSSDEIVLKIRSLFALAQHQPLTEAAAQLEIPYDSLAKLGEIGLKAQRERFDFLPSLVQQQSGQSPVIKVGSPMED